MKVFPTIPEWYSENGRSQWQRKFFEESLVPAVLKADPEATVAVVSHHCSKSRQLPVVRVESLRFGVRVWMRNNLYDWAITVESERPVTLKADPDFRGDKGLSYGCFEGFERGGLPVHGPHRSNPRRFSLHGFSSSFAAHYGVRDEEDCMIAFVGLLLTA